MRIKIRDNRGGFTLTEIVVALVILAVLAAVMVVSLIGYITKARNTRAVAECRACVIACQSLSSESYGSGTRLVGGSPPSYAGDITALAQVQGSVTEVQISDTALVTKLVYETASGIVVTYENGAYTVGGETTTAYFSGIQNGAIQNNNSVLLDFADTLPVYLESLYDIEVRSDGLLNGYWETTDGNKTSNIKKLLSAVIAANGVDYTGSFADAKVWVDTADNTKVTCIEYKIGNDAYVYYSSGNTYVLKNSAYATGSKIDWGNNEEAVLDAIAAGRTDVSVLSSSP